MGSPGSGGVAGSSSAGPKPGEPAADPPPPSMGCNSAATSTSRYGPPSSITSGSAVAEIAVPGAVDKGAEQMESDLQQLHKDHPFRLIDPPPLPPGLPDALDQLFHALVGLEKLAFVSDHLP